VASRRSGRISLGGWVRRPGFQGPLVPLQGRGRGKRSRGQYRTSDPQASSWP